MNASPSITALASALAKAQSFIEGAKKDSENPHFRSKYADLASIWDACRAPLAKHGLAIAQLPGKDDRGYYLETVLTHDSGEWIASTLYFNVTKDDLQGLGSAITYARRYALAAMVGVAPEDDDGEAATARPSTSPNSAKPMPQRPVQKAGSQPELDSEMQKVTAKATAPDPDDDLNF